MAVAVTACGSSGLSADNATTAVESTTTTEAVAPDDQSNQVADADLDEDGEQIDEPEVDAADSSNPSSIEDVPGVVQLAGELAGFPGGDRLVVVVPPDLTDDELVATAQSIHDLQPESQVFFFDDTSQMDLYLAEFEKDPTGGSEDFPREWLSEHLVAQLDLQLVPDGDGGADQEYFVVSATLEQQLD